MQNHLAYQDCQLCLDCPKQNVFLGKKKKGWGATYHRLTSNLFILFQESESSDTKKHNRSLLKYCRVLNALPHRYSSSRRGCGTPTGTGSVMVSIAAAGQNSNVHPVMLANPGTSSRAATAFLLLRPDLHTRPLIPAQATAMCYPMCYPHIQRSKEVQNTS